MDLLTDMKATVPHISTFGCKIGGNVSDETSEILEVKAYSEIMLRSLSYKKYHVTMEGDKIVNTSRQYLVQ